MDEKLCLSPEASGINAVRAKRRNKLLPVVESFSCRLWYAREEKEFVYYLFRFQNNCFFPMCILVFTIFIKVSLLCMVLFLFVCLFLPEQYFGCFSMSVVTSLCHSLFDEKINQSI